MQAPEHTEFVNFLTRTPAHERVVKPSNWGLTVNSDSNFKRFLIGKLHDVSKMYNQEYVNEFLYGSTAGTGIANCPTGLLKTTVNHAPIPARLMKVHKHKRNWIIGLKYNTVHFGVALI